MKPGAAVNLTLAKASATPQPVAVPNVVGQQEAQAADALGAAGFKVQRAPMPVTDRAQDGVVQRQAPTAGQRARKGSTVTIKVGAFQAPATTPTTTTSPPTTTDSVHFVHPGSDAACRRRPVSDQPALTVAVLAGGMSSEHEVSLASGRAVAAGLAQAGHRALWVEVGRDGAWRHDGEAVTVRPAGGLLEADVVFPGPARSLRRGRDGPGAARDPRRALRRCRRGRLGAVSWTRCCSRS